MPKIFLCDTQTYLGRALKSYFTKGEESENEIVEVSSWNDVEEVQTQLKSSDIIVLDLVRSSHQSSIVLANFKPEELEEEQNVTILGVSSIMSWNKTSTKPNPKPMREEDYKGRKSSTKFKGLKLLESLVLSAAQDNVKTYVLAPGILYGNGEEEFSDLFKDGWLCENPAGLSVLGEGNNIVPTLHVNDVALSLEALIARPPEEYQYVVVTDNTNNTQKTIVETISKGIGLGVTTQVDPAGDSVLLGNSNSEVMLLNISFDPEGSWQSGAGIELTCSAGLGGEFDKIRSEFVLNRGLKPLRSLVLGPPGAGKSLFSKQLAEKFYLPYITLGDIIQETLAKGDEFAEQVKATMSENVDAGKGKKAAKKPAAKPKKGAKVYKPDERPRIPVDMIATMVKNKLKSSACRNKGFVLDGFPQTLEQAQKLFKAELKDGEEEEPEDEPAEEFQDGEDGQPAPPKKIKVDEAVFPSYIVSLDCTEDVARQRFKEIPEGDVVADHNDEDGFDRRWQRYEYVNNLDQEVLMSPMGFFNQLELLEIPLERTVDKTVALSSMVDYMSKGGKPFNFHPTPEEKETKRLSEEATAKEEAETKRQEMEVREKEEREERYKREQADIARKKQVLSDDQELVDSCSLPLRKYLMTNVIPPLVEGLLEVCKAKPDDPIDFLSEYLFKVSVGVPEQDAPDDAGSSSSEQGSSSSGSGSGSSSESSSS